MLRNVLISLKRREEEKTCCLILRTKLLFKNYMNCFFFLKNTTPPPCKVNAINFEYIQPQNIGSKFDLRPLKKVRYSVPNYLTLALTPINPHKLNYLYTHSLRSKYIDIALSFLDEQYWQRIRGQGCLKLEKECYFSV